MTNPQAELRRQLMNALYHDDLSQVINLLNQGVNVNLPYNHNGWTPLMNTVNHPQAMMRKDLIRNLAENSDTSIKNNDCKTAYDLAKENTTFNDEKLLLHTEYNALTLYLNCGKIIIYFR